MKIKIKSYKKFNRYAHFFSYISRQSFIWSDNIYNSDKEKEN